MNSKLSLISSIVELVFGILAIIAFIILLVTGEDISKWIITLILAIAFVIMGIMSIIKYKKQNKTNMEVPYE